MSIKTKIYRAKIIASIEASAVIETLDTEEKITKQLLQEFHETMTSKGIIVVTSGANLTEMTDVAEVTALQDRLAAYKGINGKIS